jgi:hypothetical protein
MTTPEPSPDPIEVQRSLGLPAQQLWEHRVQYSHGAGLVVVSVVISKDRIPYSRIYIRHVEEEGYRPAVALPSEDCTMDGPVLSYDPPYLFYVLSRWIRWGSDYAEHYEGLGRLDLRTGIADLWETDTPGPDRCFVSELSAASPDGDAVFAVCGFRAEGGVGPVGYAMAELLWSRRSVTKKSPFRTAFF